MIIGTKHNLLGPIHWSWLTRRWQVRVWVDGDKTQMKVLHNTWEIIMCNEHNNIKSLHVVSHLHGARSAGAQKWPTLMSLNHMFLHVAFSSAVRVERDSHFLDWCKHEHLSEWWQNHWGRTNAIYVVRPIGHHLRCAFKDAHCGVWSNRLMVEQSLY